MLWKVEEGVNTDLTDFWTCAVLGKVTQIAQRTQISSLLFYVPQIARITQIYGANANKPYLYYGRKSV